MKIDEIVSRRINRKQQVFEYLRHELVIVVYDMYIILRKQSSQFKKLSTFILPSDTIYEYVDKLENILKYLKTYDIKVPQCSKLLNDLLEYLDDNS